MKVAYPTPIILCCRANCGSASRSGLSQFDGKSCGKTLFNQPVEDRRLVRAALGGSRLTIRSNIGPLFGIGGRIRDRGRRREVEPALASAARKAKRGNQRAD